MDIRKGSAILNTLEKLKFRKISEKTHKEDFGDGDRTDMRNIKNYIYERGEGQNHIKVQIEGIDLQDNEILGRIKITFSDNTSINNFISDAQKNGFSKVSSKSYRGLGYRKIYWTGADLEVNGNTIIIVHRCDGE